VDKSGRNAGMLVPQGTLAADDALFGPTQRDRDAAYRIDYAAPNGSAGASQRISAAARQARLSCIWWIARRGLLTRLTQLWRPRMESEPPVPSATAAAGRDYKHRADPNAGPTRAKRCDTAIGARDEQIRPSHLLRYRKGQAPLLLQWASACFARCFGRIPKANSVPLGAPSA